MAFEISVGPAQLTINAGECVLLTELDGQIHQPSERGLFYRDTRLLSAWRVAIDGRPWRLTSSAAVEHFAAQVVMVNPELQGDGRKTPAGSVSLTLSRLLGQCGLRETLAVRNHNRSTVSFTLSIRLVSDFADIFDVKSHKLIVRGRTESAWSPEGGRRETIHTNGPFRRGLAVSAAPGSPKPHPVDGHLCFSLAIEPQGRWETELLYQVIDGGTVLDAPDASFAERADAEQTRDLEEWCSQAMRVDSADVEFNRLFDRSVADLAALRLPIEETDTRSFVPAAGIPWFAALFGRDSLVTAIQAAPVYPDFARGALAVLARYQADAHDDSRDMQPGKIAHELRRGELAELGLVPYRPYYGTADATPLYGIAPLWWTPLTLSRKVFIDAEDTSTVRAGVPAADGRSGPRGP